MRQVFFTFLRRLRVNHWLYTGLQVILLVTGLAFAGKFSFLLPKPEHVYLLRAVSILAMITSLSLSLLFIRNQLDELQDVEGITRKLRVYHRLTLVRALIWTSSNLITLFCVLITADSLLFASFGIIILLFSIHYPARRRVVADLRLSSREMHLIREIRSFA